MKPFSIVLTILLALASLSLIVWVGRFEAKLPTVGKVKPPADAPAMAPEDVPMPKEGPFGKAEVVDATFDFGTRMAGENEKGEHIFKMKNVGEGPLAFKLGKATCQCTKFRINRENGDIANEGSIEPGESVNVFVEWQMKMPMERFRQLAPVFTNDPDQRKIEFVITGVIDISVRLFPPGIWQVGELSTSEPSKVQGYVFSKVLDAFTIVDEPRTNSVLKVTWEPADAESLEKHETKSGYLVTVEVDTKEVAIGPFRETIKLIAKSGSDETPLEFPVVGHHAGPVEIRGVAGATYNVETSRLIFGEFPAGKGKHAKVTFIFKEFDGEITLDAVEPADTRVKVTFPEKGTVLGKSKRYQADFEIPPGPPGKHRRDDAESLTLKFNNPAAPFFKILVDYQAN